MHEIYFGLQKVLRPLQSGKRSMNFISICSGIDAASVAFVPIDWKAIAFSEIEPFPCAVLAHHYPEVPNFGDMTRFREWPEAVFANADAIVGGPPCQAFSVAGLRNGLNDDRGNLTLIYAEIIDYADAVRARFRRPPVVVLYENVPGLLSDKTGAYGCFLAGLAGEDVPLEPPRGKWSNAGVVVGPKRTLAWRVLDAQFFGLAQRRRRVFVVASARDGFDPVAVLLEPESVRRDSPPSREAGEVAPTIPARSLGGGGLGIDFDCDGGVVEVCPTLRAGGNKTGGDRPPGTDIDTADSLIITMAHGQGGAEIASDRCPTITCTHEAPIAAYAIQAGALRTNPASGPDGVGVQANHAYTLEARAEVQVVQSAMQVRRLTPTEAERLQGFPDDYTLIPWRKKPASECPDGPRYKALGNSWAVPNVRWIGKRIDQEIKRGQK